MIIQLLSRKSSLIAITLSALVFAAGCGGGPESGAPGEHALRSALKANPDDGATRAKLVKLCCEDERWLDAFALLDEGLQQSPENPDILRAACNYYYDRGVASEDNNRVEQAHKFWIKLKDLGDTTSASDYALGGRITLELTWVRAAAGYYQKANAAEPGNPDWHYEGGRAYLLSGEYTKALAEFEKSHALRPTYKTTYYLGRCHLLMGDYDGAVEQYRLAVEMDNAAEWESLPDRLTDALFMANAQICDGKASAHYCTAWRHSEHGRLDRMAAEYLTYLDVTAALKEAGAPAEDYACREGTAHRELTRLYCGIGRYEQALYHDKKAIEYGELLGDASSLAATYEGYGHTLASLADAFDEASADWRAYHEQSLAARLKGLAFAREAGNTHRALHLQAGIALEHCKLHGLEDERSVEARAALQDHLPKENTFDCSVVDAARAEAVYRMREEDWAGARELLEFCKSYYFARLTANSTDGRMWLQQHLALTAYHLGDYEQAITDARTGLDQLDWLRTRYIADKHKRLGNNGRASSLASQILMATLETEEHGRAFRFVEQYKGRALLDLLGTRPDPATRPAPEVTEAKIIRLARMQDMEDLVDEALETGDEYALRGLERNLVIERTEYRRLAEDTSAAEVELRSDLQVPILTQDELAPLVAENTMLSYVIGYAGVYCLVANGEDYHVYSCGDLSEKDLTQLVQQMRLSLGAREDTVRDLVF